MAPPVADPPTGAPVGLLSIPRLAMSNSAIVEGTGENQLQQGPGHYQGTPLPGEAGNASIAGHRTTYGAPFYDLNALIPGDDIYVQTPQGTFAYQVTGSAVVAPTDTQVLSATTVPTLTLTTCNPRYSASSRLVVTAVLRSGLAAGNAAPVSAPRPTTSTTLPPTLAGEAGVAGDVNTHTEALVGALWGAGALGASVLAYLGWRRLGPRSRWVSVAIGVPAALILLFICFGHVSLALPETF